jgi:hypothetical protein
VKLAVLFPAATPTLAGTCSSVGSLLLSATTAPPGGAGTVRPTVPSTVPTPPTTALGVTPIVNSGGVPVSPGSTRRVAACSWPVNP